jgi:translation initiation factor IF-3
MIRVPQVRVVDEEGLQLGVMPTQQALGMAQDRGFDLVEVAPMASPPVVRFLDFGQFKYEQTKRDKDAKRRSRVGFKEVRLSPKIGIGDFQTKVHRALEFLEEGDRIKVTVRFRGRELTHPELGRNLLAKFTEAVKDHATVERPPILEGKSMFAVLASTHKPKVHEHGRPAEERTEGEAPEAPEAAAAAAPEPTAPEPTAPAATVPEPTAPAAKAPEPTAAEPAAAEPAAAEPEAPAAAAPTATNGQPRSAAPAASDAPSPAPEAPAPRPATPPKPPADPGADAAPAH